MSLSLYPAASISKPSNASWPSSLASCFREREILLPNFSQAKSKSLTNGHRSSIRGVGWSIDGRRLATCSVDRSIRIWVPERSIDHRASTELRGHNDSVDQLVWHPTNPEVLATASADRSARIWDVRVKASPSEAGGIASSDDGVSVINTPGSNINIAYHPSGDYLAVGDKSDTVSILDTRTNKILHTVCSRRPTPPTNDSSYTPTTVLASWDEVNELTFSNDGSLLLLTSGSGSVHIHHTDSSPDSYARIHSHNAHPGNVFCLTPDPLGRFYATASSDSMISLWDSREWLSRKMITTLVFPARTMGFSFDGELLAAGGEDPFISIHATITTTADDLVHKLPLAQGSMINTLAWHPTKYVLAYAGDETAKSDIGGVKVFNLS
ncbi:related to THO complex subunit 3 [Melanopsichium pennsylvanicum]|uniref:Related to THO complex subunit 3 n=2 Tax=Melanopsichium pennsylvanicum TaxID=63383 RepID=A0AAJ4XNY1_9BASI|nr:related to THO complex subunit 3 [Melanopsichium pennsylvanicum 4]SNX84503.1 related to THO complex subunit 3 [Melanopsichium pennsylvanicum]